MINLINPNILKLLIFFSDSPGRKYLRNEIKSATGFNNVVLDDSLTILVHSKFLLIEKKLYYLSLENEELKFFLKEIKKTFLKLPLEISFLIIDFINRIQKFREVKQGFIFGSYAKLIYHKDSDVDIAIIIDKGTNPKIKKTISIMAEKISKKYKKEIQEHFFTIEDLKEKGDPLIKDLLRNNIEII